MDLSGLVNNLKTVLSRRLRHEFAKHLGQFYQKPGSWHGTYYVGSVGNASLETVKRYIEEQGQDRWSAKRREAQENRRSTA
ncbi:MAG TPA: transposase [Azospirillum sp.]|nr:transposase [Azospirillum sp.]